MPFYHLAKPPLGLFQWTSDWSSSPGVSPYTLLRVMDFRSCCFWIQNPLISHRVKASHTVVHQPPSTQPLFSPVQPVSSHLFLAPWLQHTGLLTIQRTCQVYSCLRPLAVPVPCEALPQMCTWSTLSFLRSLLKRYLLSESFSSPSV